MARFVTASVDGIASALHDAEGQFATIVTAAMRGATDTLKATLRDQVVGAGLGQRLANTWRAEVYPSDEVSLNPAGWAYSKAPDIISAFASGATIRPVNGGAYLWVPTKNVPRAIGGGRTTSTSKMTPEQVLASFGAEEFVIRIGKGGRKLAFVTEKRGMTVRGARKRVRRGRIGHGDDSELILMFTLTPAVQVDKKIDLDAAAQTGATDFVERVESGGV